MAHAAISEGFCVLSYPPYSLSSWNRNQVIININNKYQTFKQKCQNKSQEEIS